MATQNEQWLLNEKYGGQTSDAFFADRKRLQNGEPLAYIIGHVPFLNTKIYLDSHPLIPRPETEFWVEKAIEEIKKVQSDPLRILDLCAGSGCIGVAVAHAIPEARVDFAELDVQHHATIKKNLKENKIESNHAQIFGGDLFEKINDQYSYILCNPPYIDPAIDRVDAGVKKHEPHTALYGGKKGLELIERIINEAPQYLKEDGTLYIEHEPEQSAVIKECAEKNGFKAVAHKDQYDLGRYSVLTRF